MARTLEDRGYSPDTAAHTAPTAAKPVTIQPATPPVLAPRPTPTVPSPVRPTAPTPFKRSDPIENVKASFRDPDALATDAINAAEGPENLAIAGLRKHVIEPVAKSAEVPSAALDVGAHLGDVIASPIVAVETLDPSVVKRSIDELGASERAFKAARERNPQTTPGPRDLGKGVGQALTYGLIGLTGALTNVVVDTAAPVLEGVGLSFKAPEDAPPIERRATPDARDRSDRRANADARRAMNATPPKPRPLAPPVATTNEEVRRYQNRNDIMAPPVVNPSPQPSIPNIPDTSTATAAAPVLETPHVEVPSMPDTPDTPLNRPSLLAGSNDNPIPGLGNEYVREGISAGAGLLGGGAGGFLLGRATAPSQPSGQSHLSRSTHKAGTHHRAAPRRRSKRRSKKTHHARKRPATRRRRTRKAKHTTRRRRRSTRRRMTAKQRKYFGKRRR